MAAQRRPLFKSRRSWQFLHWNEKPKFWSTKIKREMSGATGNDTKRMSKIELNENNRFSWFVEKKKGKEKKEKKKVWMVVTQWFLLLGRSKWYANKRGKIEYNITSATKRRERSENAWNIEKGNIEIRWELDQSFWSSKKTGNREKLLRKSLAKNDKSRVVDIQFVRESDGE